MVMDRESTQGAGPSLWIRRLQAVLGSLAVTIGFWMLWSSISAAQAIGVALLVAAFLIWSGSTSAHIWAWTTLLLGLESLAWPVSTIVQERMTEGQPSAEQMGQILTAMLFGLFAGVFWITFAYGIWARWIRQPAPAAQSKAVSIGSRQVQSRRRKR